VRAYPGACPPAPHIEEGYGESSGTRVTSPKKRVWVNGGKENEVAALERTRFRRVAEYLRRRMLVIILPVYRIALYGFCYVGPPRNGDSVAFDGSNSIFFNVSAGLLTCRSGYRIGYLAH